MMLILLACTATPVQDSGGVDTAPPVDPYAAYDRVLETGVLEIPPYTDMMWCSPGVWDDETLGLGGMLQEQADSGHHAMLMRSRDALPSQPWDCTNSMEMGTGPALEPIIEQGAMLPDGIAVSMPQGTEWVIQSHHINPTGETLQVQDRLHLKTLQPEEVEHWAVPWGAQAVELNIAPGVEDVVFECSWPQDLMVLSLMGHMHEWGTRFEAELYRDGAWSSLYEVDPWHEEYRNAPIQKTWDEDELVITPSERVRITCAYDNTSGGTLNFPTEMCGASGNAVYPGEAFCSYWDP